MDGKKSFSGVEYCKRAKEKEDKQKHVIKKSRKLDNFFGKPSTDAEDHEKSICSGATPTDSASVSSSASTLVVFASGSKEKAEEVPPVPRVQPNSDQRLCKISDDPNKWIIDDFTRDYICKNGANQNIKNDFPKSERIYKHKARHLSEHLFERQLVNGEKVPKQRLKDLALLNIEADYLSKMDCEELINDFAALKCRRVL
ncbi:unnamed protein product [Parnassius apollo]|uniref:(apollo) hypothetical protein n=1 Tax=Parnassius apollo TaxID=110799 RepID=A0A8S3WZ44_PARAO|nr:unnamed protein product [Parnassius apollo]